MSRCKAYHFVGDRSAMEQQGSPQEQPAEICPGEPETGVVEEARAEPQPAVTQTAASKGYQKKRSTFTVPDGYEKVNVVDILKPKPGSAVSAVWQHVDTYAKAAAPHISVCKCCGSNIKNEPLRASTKKCTVLQHFEQKTISDHGHWCALQLAKGSGGQNQTQLRLQTAKTRQSVPWSSG